MDNVINGFIEGAEFLGIDPRPENEAYKEYAESILEPIYRLNKRDRDKENGIMFNTEFVPAENLGVKFAKWDKKDGYFVPRPCYNSYFYRVEDETLNLLDRFKLHGREFTRYLDGGSAGHWNMDEHLTKEQYLKLMHDAIQLGVPYFTFNIPNTICNDCGYISKHRLKECPKCGSHNLDYATRVNNCACCWRRQQQTSLIAGNSFVDNQQPSPIWEGSTTKRAKRLQWEAAL